jgi:predicted MFS family arabinose efflux permease
MNFKELNAALLAGPKLIYITMSCAFYGFYVYRTNWATDVLGFNTQSFGDMSASMALVGFVSMALWGSLTDWSGRPRAVLSFVATCTAGSFSLFLIDWKAAVGDGRGLYVVYMGILMLYAMFSAGFQALSDDQTLRLLSHTTDTRLYGRQRVFETLFFGVTNAALGPLIDTHGLAVLYYWIPVACLSFMAMIYVFGTDEPMRRTPEDIPIVASEKGGDDQIMFHQKESIMASTTDLLPLEPLPKMPFRVLLSNPSFLFLLFGVFLTGFARTVMSTFLTHYLKNEMTLTATETGRAAVCGIVFEVLVFLMSAHFLRAIGIYWMLILAQVAMVVRGWAYVFIPADAKFLYAVYGVELLKGIAFGLTQTAGVRLASELVPPGLEATAQSLYTGMYSMFPGVLAAFVGGRVYQNFGAKILFIATASLSSAALCLFVVKYSYDRKI